MEASFEAAQETPIDLRYQSVELSVSSRETVRYEGVEVSVVTPAEAEQLFRELSALSYLPQKYIDDGCYARAHELALVGAQNGLELGKVFMVPERPHLLYPRELSEERARSLPPSFSGWRYHTSAFVMVREGDRLTPYVFDVGVAQGPTPLEDWQNSLLRSDRQREIVVRDRGYVFHDSSFQQRNQSVISRLKETEELIDEIGYDEYIFRVEQGWL